MYYHYGMWDCQLVLCSGCPLLGGYKCTSYHYGKWECNLSFVQVVLFLEVINVLAITMGSGSATCPLFRLSSSWRL